MPTGLYIHIPFCLRKCPYCDFYSVTMEDSLADAYVDKVNQVIRSGRFPVTEVETIYFGGGTPSLLGPERLEAILTAARESYTVTPDAEVTLEVNPVSVEAEAFASLRDIGINRLSVGVQSGNDRELRLLGRLHSAKEAERCILAAHAGGFDNISADLMLDTPEQTEDSLAASIDFITGLPVSHVSAYLLKVEEGTAYYDRGVAPSEDDSADRYLQCCAMLAEKGFPQYEISNFAKPGAESRHNLKYWLSEPYLGVGPAAHSSLDGRRFSFRRDLAGFLEEPFSILEEEGPAGGLEEEVMLRLRLTEGLDLADMEARFGVEAGLLSSRADIYIQRGLAKLERGYLHLTPEGFLLSNRIIGTLLD